MPGSVFHNIVVESCEASWESFYLRKIARRLTPPSRQCGKGPGCAMWASNQIQREPHERVDLPPTGFAAGEGLVKLQRWSDCQRLRWLSYVGSAGLGGSGIANFGPAYSEDARLCDVSHASFRTPADRVCGFLGRPLQIRRTCYLCLSGNSDTLLIKRSEVYNVEMAGGISVVRGRLGELCT